MSEHARRGAAPPLAPVRTAVLVTLMVVLTAASAWFGLYLLVTAGAGVLKYVLDINKNRQIT